MLRRHTTSKHCRSFFLPVLLAGIFFSWLACENPFATRTPEPPVGAGSRWIPPFAAEVVIENLLNAVADLNVENYVRCFSDSSRTGLRFLFIPEITVANNNHGVFENWSLTEERHYFSQLRTATPTDSIRVLKLEALQTSLFGDSAQFIYVYDLTVRHNRQNSGVPGNVNGELRFWLLKDSFGEWAIQRWADFATAPERSWSALKVAFGQ